MWWLVQQGHTNYNLRVPSGKLSTLSTQEILDVAKDPRAQLAAFGPEQYVPIWIPIIYLVSNVILNSLNIFWFWQDDRDDPHALRASMGH